MDPKNLNPLQKILIGVAIALMSSLALAGASTAVNSLLHTGDRTIHVDARWKRDVADRLIRIESLLEQVKAEQARRTSRVYEDERVPPQPR